MTDNGYQRYFEILEVRPEASLPEVKDSYLKLRELYAADSIVTLPIKDEFSEECRKEILSAIDDAYARLVGLFERRQNQSGYQLGLPSNLEQEMNLGDTQNLSFSGRVLQQIRQKLRIDLCEIARSTKIGKEYLSSIEREDFDELPPEVYVRGFVSAYAKCLSLDASRVLDDYMKRYRLRQRTAGYAS